jgi:hypothetical protein
MICPVGAKFMTTFFLGIIVAYTPSVVALAYLLWRAAPEEQV